MLLAEKISGMLSGTRDPENRRFRLSYRFQLHQAILGRRMSKQIPQTTPSWSSEKRAGGKLRFWTIVSLDMER
jgi:hypothetical protein